MVSSESGTVVPKMPQNDEPVWPSPDSAATGASTYDVRMPPKALPFGSRGNSGESPPSRVTNSRGARVGARPPPTQRSSAASAASPIQCCGPELIGEAQSMMPGSGDAVTSTAATDGSPPTSLKPTLSV